MRPVGSKDSKRRKTKRKNISIGPQLLQQIKEDILSGMAQYVIAKKYDLPPNRISQININMYKNGEKRYKYGV
jgi:hypothetical protein